MTEEGFRFGEFVLDVARGALRGPAGPVPLRPKCFALLHYLILHAGRLIGKDELMSQLWPDVVVTDDSLSRCISEIRAAIDDRSQEIVKTVARRGYLFAASVTPLPAAEASPPPALVRTAPEPPADVPGKGPAVRPWERHRPRWVTVALIVAATVFLWRTGLPEEPPRRLSLVVLPFASVDDGVDRDVLPMVVTEGLTIALSRLHGSAVISPATVGTFKERQTDVRKIGQELNVRYVVRGSVLSQGDTLRIAAQLLESGDGRTIWSDQFDTRRGDLLATQDRIIVRLANALGVALVSAASRAPTVPTLSRPDAEALALRCEARASIRLEPDAVCQQALELDPRNVRALSALALYHADRAERRQGPDPALDQAQARQWADRALALEPSYYAVQCAYAVVLTGDRRVREAVEAAERCQALNPSHAQAYRILATLHFFLGEPQRTLEYAERGMVLSPRDPQIVGFLLFKGWAYFMMGRDEDAIVWLRRAAAARPDGATMLPPLISVLALTGRTEEARGLLARYESLPGAGARTVSRWEGQPDDNPGFLAFGERFKSGLRRAGMSDR